MPSTPTLTLRSSSSGGYIAAKASNPGTAPSFNELWRQSDEYLGLAVRICSNMRVNGQFHDHAVASGKSYNYFLRAVDAGGATADSAPVSASITLTSARLHGVAKGQKSANLNGYSLAITDLVPHLREFQFAMQSYMASGADKPDALISSIEEHAIGFTIRIAAANDKDRLTLRAIYNMITAVCLRDTIGNKVFGTMGPYVERFNFGYTDVPFTLDAMDFTEHF